MSELNWVAIARSYIGTYEITGAKHNPKILDMWKNAFMAIGQKTWIHDDETAWCGGFVGGVMAQADLACHIPKNFPSARAWASVGTKLEKPAYGCVVVFSRDGGGHVGFCVGKDKNGNLMVLGGNQSNAVNIKPFSQKRVIAYRWLGTQDLPNPSRYNLPLLQSDGKVSTNEA